MILGAVIHVFLASISTERVVVYARGVVTEYLLSSRIVYVCDAAVSVQKTPLGERQSVGR